MPNVIQLRASDSDDDASLIDRARRGDGAAFERLFERHIKMVVRVLSRVLGSDPDVPDLANEVLHLSFDRIGELANPDRFGAYLSGVSVNVARNHLRAKKRRQWLVFGVEADEPEASDGSDAREALTATYDVLAGLSEDLRICFALRYIDGRDLGEVAELTGVSLATTKRWLQKAEQAFLEAARRNPVLEAWVQAGSRWGGAS